MRVKEDDLRALMFWPNGGHNLHMVLDLKLFYFGKETGGEKKEKSTFSKGTRVQWLHLLQLIMKFLDYI